MLKLQDQKTAIETRIFLVRYARSAELNPPRSPIPHNSLKVETFGVLGRDNVCATRHSFFRPKFLAFNVRFTKLLVLCLLR